MKKINFKDSNRQKTFDWFKSFSNSTYSMNVRMDVTKLVKYVKENKHSFFIDLLYIVVNGLNSTEEMRMRLVNDEPVLFETINPAFTVMTKTNTFENVRFEYVKDYSKFYEIASQKVESAKNQTEIKKENYNPENCYNEYYITCVPWTDYVEVSHPIPDDKSSQCIPRICWGKYTENNGKFELTLNITVSHIFVDGYPLSMTFNKIQEMLNDVENILQ